MARIRTVKPEFWLDEEISEVSAESALLAIGLLNISDDEGFFRANPGLVRAAIFPLRELSITIPGMFQELSGIGYIRLFEGVDGKKYGEVVQFLKHQKISKPYPSKIKDLEAFLEHSGNGKETLPLGTGNREQGKEQGKGKEKHLPSDKPEGAPDDNQNEISEDAGSDPSTEKPKPQKSKYKFDNDQHKLAARMAVPVQQRFSSMKIDVGEWADAVRKLVEIDGHTQTEIVKLWHWIINHDTGSFSWADNCRTPMKLRKGKEGLKYFEIIKIQMNRDGPPDDPGSPLGGSGPNSPPGGNEPRTISENWEPSSEALNILFEQHGIDLKFAKSLVPEFILFWRDTKIINRSWNAKFIQHAKYCWENNGPNDKPQSLAERMTDTTWADHLIESDGNVSHETIIR